MHKCGSSPSVQRLRVLQALAPSLETSFSGVLPAEGVKHTLMDGYRLDITLPFYGIVKKWRALYVATS